MDAQDNRTRFQPGPASSNLPVASGTDVQIEAYQRSPTLMAGETPGSQGNVRVWSPSRRALWISFTGFGLGSIVLMAGMIFSGSFGGLSYLLGSMIAACFLSARALRRPCYLTTDEAGIGITTSKSSVALRWDEIVTARFAGDDPVYRFDRIVLMAPSRVTINLTGYSSRLQNEIFGMIRRKAQLQPHPARPKIYVDPSRPLPEGIGVFESENADIRACLAAGD